MERPTLRQLEYLVAVAEAGTIGRAADAMRVTQPAMSAQIAELERRLGVTVFERGRTGTRITADGAEVLEAARTVLDDIERLVEVADVRADDIVGALRVGVIPTMAPYLLPTFVRELRRRYPSAEPHLSEIKTAELVDRLETGRLDLGLLATPVPEVGSSLATAELARDPFVLALPVGHHLASERPLPAAALSTLPMLLLEEGHCLRSHAQSACSLIGASELASIQATSLPAACQMVAAGMGATLLPASAVAVEARPGSGIVTRPLRRPEPFRTVTLTWRARAGRAHLFARLAADLAGPVGRACSLEPAE